MNAGARALLPKPKDAQSFIFECPANQILNKRLKRIAKKANININLTMHTARHTFATSLLNQGVQIEIVSALLGHKKIATTQIYAQILPQKKTQAVLVLDKIYEKS